MTSYIVQYQRVDSWKRKNKISWIGLHMLETKKISVAREIKNCQEKVLGRKARIIKTTVKESIVK
jgi:hypothetical protein